MRISSSIPILIFVLFVGVCLSITAHAQEAETPEIEWTVYIGGSDNDWPGGISLAPDGYIYVSGITGSEDIEGHLNTNSWVSAYLSKISEKGEILWSRYCGGLSMDMKGLASSDTEGNIYIAGNTFLGDLADSSKEEFVDKWVGYVDKISSDGDVLWQKIIGGERLDTISAISVSSDNEKIFVVGYTQSRTMNNRFVNEDNKDNDDCFMAMLDREGNIIWIRFIAGKERDIPFGLTLSDDGDIYIVGLTYSDDLPKRTNEYSGERDAFVTKMSSDGEILWTTYVGSPGRDVGKDIAMDSEGNVYITGETSYTDRPKPILVPLEGEGEGSFMEKHDDRLPEADLPAALNSRFWWGQEAFVTKLTPQGEILWSKYVGGNSTDRSNSIVIDSDDNIFISGTTDSRNFSKKVNEFYEHATNSYIAELTPEGEHKWSYLIGGEAIMRGSKIEVKDGFMFMAAGTDSKNLPNKLNEIHYNHIEQRLPPDVFVMRIRLPVDAEAEVDGINDGDGEGGE